jgi:hypothetical protein
MVDTNIVSGSPELMNGINDTNNVKLTVNMYDSYGDGWIGHTIKITDKNDSNKYITIDPDFDSVILITIHLPFGEYDVTITPDSYPHEIRWEIVDKDGIVLVACDTSEAGDTSAFPKFLQVGPPAANICMPAGTLVQTDQGEVAVEKLTSENTIEGNLVLEVTKSLNQSKKFVVIRKGAFGHNLPLRTTRVTPNHSVMYRGRMTKASRLVNGVTVGVQQRPTMDVVYNVVLGNKDDSSAYHGSMSVNGLVVETVKPEHALRLKEM